MLSAVLLLLFACTVNCFDCDGYQQDQDYCKNELKYFLKSLNVTSIKYFGGNNIFEDVNKFFSNLTVSVKNFDLHIILHRRIASTDVDVEKWMFTRRLIKWDKVNVRIEHFILCNQHLDKNFMIVDDKYVFKFYLSKDNKLSFKNHIICTDDDFYVCSLKCILSHSKPIDEWGHVCFKRFGQIECKQCC